MFGFKALLLLLPLLLFGASHSAAGPAPARSTKVEMRVFAAKCYEDARYKKSAAAAAFRARYGAAVRDAGRFCKKWYRRIRLLGSAEDLPRPGRKRLIAPEAATRAARIFEKGMNKGKPADNFCSVAEGCREKADFNSCRLVPGREEPASYRTLLRAMRRQCPTLTTRSLRYKPPLSKKNRRWRHLCSRKNLQRWHDNPNYFKRIMWVDAKTMWVVPKRGRKVWVNSLLLRPGDLVVTHDALTSSGRPSKRRMRLEYYACVNAVLGPIDLVYVTGTTGRRPRYKVRPRCRARSPAVPAALRARRQPPTGWACGSWCCT